MTGPFNILGYYYCTLLPVSPRFTPTLLMAMQVHDFSISSTSVGYLLTRILTFSATTVALLSFKLKNAGKLAGRCTRVEQPVSGYISAVIKRKSITTVDTPFPRVFQCFNLPPSVRSDGKRSDLCFSGVIPSLASFPRVIDTLCIMLRPPPQPSNAVKVSLLTLFGLFSGRPRRSRSTKDVRHSAYGVQRYAFAKLLADPAP